MHARSAKLPDAFAIEQLIQVHVGDGTLLPRTLAEICENIRDFIVVEKGGEIVGCGALHLYGMHLAEIRSITVTKNAKGRGAGRVLIDALLKEAQKQSVTCVCLFTRIPDFFGKMGFQSVEKEALPDKMFKDCVRCSAAQCVRRDRDVSRHATQECWAAASAGCARLCTVNVAAAAGILPRRTDGPKPRWGGGFAGDEVGTAMNPRP